MSEVSKDIPPALPATSSIEFMEIHSDALIPRTRVKSILIATGVAIAVILAAVLVAVMAGMAGASAAISRFLPMIAILIVFDAYFIWRWLWQRDLKSILGSHDNNPVELAATAVEQMREKGPRFTVAGFRVLGREFLNRGWLGHSFRIAPKVDQPTPAPLDVAIEPLPLDEASEPFLQLSSSGSAPAATAAAKNLELSESVRRFRRSFAFIWLTVLMFSLISIPHIINLIRTGRPSINLMVYATVIGMLFLQASVGLDRKRNRLLAVNGGLLLRKSNWLGGAPQLHLFRRDNSVLFVFRMQKKQWWWAVFGPGYEKGTWMFGTASEAELLLRAWLSPLPPPEIERLSDFQ